MTAPVDASPGVDPIVDERVDRVRCCIREVVSELGLNVSPVQGSNQSGAREPGASQKNTIDGFEQPFAEQENRQDPFDQSVTCFGFWRDANGQLLGSVQLRDSGRVYAEYDLVCQHPTRPGWFIESVTVWGDDSGLKSELQLLPLPGN